MKMIMFDLGNTLETVINGQDVLLSGALKMLEDIQALRDNLGQPPIMALASDFGKINATPAEIAASQQEYIAILETLGIRHFFEPTAKKITLSTEANALKPSKKIFQTAIKKFPGLEFSQVLFLTENGAHVQKARLLKMQAVQFKAPGQPDGDIAKLKDFAPIARKFLTASTAPDPAPAAVPAAAPLVPGTPAECMIWIGQSFHIRVLLAISDWSLESATTLTATMTLGALAKGTPWGAGQQARLVNATNSRVVFFPFASTMLPPGVLLPATTTVAQWEKVVFRQQDPKTPCFVFGG